MNEDTLPLVALESMQFGHALERILREILLANPAHGPVHLNKTDLSDGFYREDLCPGDAPKLGVVYPTKTSSQNLVAIPLVLPMGWKNSPPAFSTATETIADLANRRLRDSSYSPPRHALDDLAARSDAGSSERLPPAVRLPGASVARPIERSPPAAKLPGTSVAVQSKRDPSLPTTGPPVQYVDIFVDDFVGLGQQPTSRGVRKTLLHAIDHVFHPLGPNDSPFRREPVSIKKLRQGDGSWGTIKLVLGWIIRRW